MVKIFVDTETTGLNEWVNSLLEIAAVATDEEGNVLSTFHEYINPGCPIPAKIVEITRITDAKVRDCRKEKEVLDDFVTWIYGLGCDEFIAHNASFDFRMLSGRCFVNKIDDHPFKDKTIVDTMKIVSAMLKTGKLVTERTPSGRFSKKQESVARALNIQYGDGGAHSAIEDVIVLKKMYFKLKEMGC